MLHRQDLNVVGFAELKQDLKRSFVLRARVLRTTSRQIDSSLLATADAAGRAKRGFRASGVVVGPPQTIQRGAGVVDTALPGLQKGAGPVQNLDARRGSRVSTHRSPGYLGKLVLSAT